METKIHRLSEEMINIIAAGEVVENPASVVKELIENSLDAGASRIEISCLQGGLEAIRIDDNGCGMSREDALLSLERHATSKIASHEDLFALATMGFRGEALAAIHAISHLEMKTSLHEMGVKIRGSGGKILGAEPIARKRGTTIEIQSLFYNVPARKKFQKSSSVLTSQIRKTVETIALAYPQIAFSLECDKSRLLELLPQSLEERISQILGPFAHQKHHGFFGAPHDAKTHRRDQYLYVNKRAVFSPLVSKAVKEGYGTRIPEQHHPRFLLFLEIPPDQVDVNVHPQKKEVRFREESALFQQIRALTQSVFEMPSFQEPLCFDPPSEWKLAEEIPFFEPVAANCLPFVFTERVVGVFDGLLLLEKEGLILVDLRLAEAEVMGRKRETKQYTTEEALRIWEELKKSSCLRYDSKGRVVWKEITRADLEGLLK